MPTTRPPVVAAAAALVVLLLAGRGCASAPTAGSSAAAPSDSSAASAARGGVLASFVGQPLVIAPSQRLRAGADAPAWAPAAAAAPAYLATVDDEIAAALADRGVDRGWVLPAQVVRAARRNPTFATDPHALSVDPLLTPVRPPAAGVEVADPLRSQLRAVTALSEARFVLVPVSLRFERAGGANGGANGGASDAGRAVLRLVLVDTRLARVGWAGDVVSDASSSLSPAIAASLADRVANLAAPAP